MTEEDFLAKWHSSKKDAVTGNSQFLDLTDNRNETNKMTTNVTNKVNLTYVVTELPNPPSATGSGSGSTNNENQGSSQHSGSNNSTPPTLTDSEPNIDETRYHSVVTGSKTEAIANEITTTVNSAFQQRLHGIQSYSVAPSTAVFGTTPLEYRENISRTASTDRKSLIADSECLNGTAPINEVKIRKSTEIVFEPNKITVTIDALSDGENLTNRAIVSKRIHEEYQGYIYETKNVFDGDYTFVISAGSNGTEVASDGIGTHGMQSRSFVEWKDPEFGVFLRLQSRHETSVGSGGLKYSRVIALNEDQGSISRSTTAQQSELPEFDSTWLRTGELSVVDTNVATQANIGTTQTIVKWVMPNKKYSAYSLTKYTDRHIKRSSDVETTLIGNLDGTSKTRTVTTNLEEQNWEKQNFAATSYEDTTWYAYSESSTYTGWNNGSYEEKQNRERESFFTGIQETGRIDNLVESITTNGHGESFSSGKDGTTQIFEHWTGTNTRSRTDTHNSMGAYNLGPEVVNVTQRMKRNGVYDQNSDNPIAQPDRHFSLGRLMTLDYPLATPANYNSYTSYWGTVHAQRVDTFFGGVGMIVGGLTMLTGVGTKVGALVFVTSADQFIGGLRGAISAQQTESLLTMAAAGAYEWALQSTTNNSDFKLTPEERRASGDIAAFGLIFGVGVAGKLARVRNHLTVAAQIFRQTTAACDDISKMGRAMKSFQEAGEVLAGRSDIHKSIRNILDNYCFVGSVDVAAYATENRWAALIETRETPLAATPVLLRSEVAAGWIIIGAGAVALLQVFSGRTSPRNSEEREEAWPELAWA